MYTHSNATTASDVMDHTAYGTSYFLSCKLRYKGSLHLQYKIRNIGVLKIFFKACQ